VNNVLAKWVVVMLDIDFLDNFMSLEPEILSLYLLQHDVEDGFQSIYLSTKKDENKT
jgi:hypothetical protein